MRDVSRTTVSVNVSRPVAIRYICENCGKTNIELSKLVKRGAAVHQGIVLRERIKDEMEDFAVSNGLKKIGKAEYDLIRGFENTIRHDVTVNPQCSYCKATQSWAKHMNRVINTKTMGTSVCALLIVLSFILVIITRVEALIYIFLSSIFGIIFFRFLLPFILKVRLKHILNKININERPSVISINKAISMSNQENGQ